MTWQPIDTAPEGVDVIVWVPSNEDFYKAWSSDWDIDNKYGLLHRWYYLDGDGVTECTPTHWMLPGPPKSQEKNDGTA